jgi:hypothetical protein
MPIYRGPDGKIIEERTRKVTSSKGMTEKVPVHAEIRETSDSDKTRKVGGSPAPAHAEAGKAAAAGGHEKTRYVDLAGRGGAQPAHSLSDPVVGWLVVVKGPGSGNSLTLGYGANSIGRAETNRLRLDFGDDQISRSSHAVLTYDPRGRKFYIQPGTGTGLVYIDDQPVLTPRELAARTRIQLGNTVLCFVPLCGDSFDWQELP